MAIGEARRRREPGTGFWAGVGYIIGGIILIIANRPERDRAE